MTPTNYDESKVPAYTLPPLLVSKDGSEIKTAFDWVRKRRPEILQTLKDEVFGELPPRPESFTKEVISVKEDALDNTAIRKEIKLTFSHKGKSHSFVMLLYIPKNAPAPVPVFIGLNFKGNHTTTVETDVMQTGRNLAGELLEPDQFNVQGERWSFAEAVRRGFASATVNYNDIHPDDKDTTSWRKSIYNLFFADETDEQFHTHGGSISCWAWGLSRMLDALEDEPLIDTSRAMVHGHSRLGKTALWAGANDPRFRLVISNDSGCCGAALHRRVFGETIEVVCFYFPQWFTTSLRKYICNETALPYDQHHLVALSAPRPVCIASASEDLWADPKGEFLSGYHASEVYQLFGVKGMPQSEVPEAGTCITGEVSYHCRIGKHDQTRFDWDHYFDIADKYVR